MHMDANVGQEISILLFVLYILDNEKSSNTCTCSLISFIHEIFCVDTITSVHAVAILVS